MKATNIAFTGIPVTDMKRARAFYEGALGLKPSAEYMEGGWVEYELGDDTIAIT
jgi:catechol 2,3-dioxygenase-like lactoylglutathione lyase family enzyme